MTTRTEKASTAVLVTLCASQFLMTLDTSVMNVSIATVAQDVGTDITGIQTAITLYALVMASMMIIGGKLGQIWGRKRAYSIGLLVYAAGSFVTSISHSLPILIFGWSLLEGLGAALILPAVVALVASNFSAPERPRAYGLVASAGAIAVAAGPLIGGAFTTYLSWRYVFVLESISVFGILALARRVHDTEVTEREKIDVVGAILTAAGLALIVFGILKLGTWGLILPKPGAPTLFGLSAVVWLILSGGLALIGFFNWEERRTRLGLTTLVTMSLLRKIKLRAGLNSFFFQFFIQAGMFFIVPLYLSVALGLSAVDTGVRLLPLSATLLLAAVGVPRWRPNASPRRVVAIGFLVLFAGLVTLIMTLSVSSSAAVVTGPLLLAGLGIGALASQLGAVTVSSVPDSFSGEVGGLQNTVTNLGASVGTALAGAVLISALTASFISGVQNNPQVPESVKTQATTQLSSGVPFVSNAQLETALLTAGVDQSTTDEIVKVNESARIQGLQSALAVLAGGTLIAFVASRRLPTKPVSSASGDEDEPTEE